MAAGQQPRVVHARLPETHAALVGQGEGQTPGGLIVAAGTAFFDDLGGGLGGRPIGAGVDLVVFPFKVDIASPKMASALLTSSKVMGLFLMVFILSNALKF